jgi:hypothetical protein
LQKVVRRALSLERSRRYATMAEFERALCDAAARAGIDGRLGDVDAALAGPGWAERRASPMQTPSRPRPVVWAACALSLFAAPYLGARTARARSADEAPVAAGQATEVAPAPVARFTPGAPAAVGLLCR